MWNERLPRTPLLDDTDPTTRHEPPASTIHDGLAGLLDGDERPRILVYAEGVLASLADALGHHRASIDPRLDTPTVRVLDLVMADIAQHRREAAGLHAPPRDDDGDTAEAIADARASLAGLLAAPHRRDAD